MEGRIPILGDTQTFPSQQFHWQEKSKCKSIYSSNIFFPAVTEFDIYVKILLDLMSSVQIDIDTHITSTHVLCLFSPVWRDPVMTEMIIFEHVLPRLCISNEKQGPTVSWGDRGGDIILTNKAQMETGPDKNLSSPAGRERSWQYLISVKVDCYLVCGSNWDSSNCHRIPRESPAAVIISSSFYSYSTDVYTQPSTAPGNSADIYHFLLYIHYERSYDRKRDM